ncbi:MAG: superoxide dismutase [Planctomycetes bacterium]|nr:superoxide dismutase [Planctomycetota bacterium]
MSSSTTTTTRTDPSRREMLAALGIGAAALAGVRGAAGQTTMPQPASASPMTPQDLGWDPQTDRYILPPLPYPYDALEPYIDTQTMQLHHDKHHAGYVRGLNASLDALDEMRTARRGVGETKHWSRQLAFNGSGHFLHVIFWNCMGPNGAGMPRGLIAERIDRDFGSFKQFRQHFETAARSVEGSGWAILVLEPTSQRLMVMQAEKHQNLTAWGVVPLLAIDVWEHAYYLKYQNRRTEYVSAFMNIINWDFVQRKLSGLIEAFSPKR